MPLTSLRTPGMAIPPTSAAPARRLQIPPTVPAFPPAPALPVAPTAPPVLAAPILTAPPPVALPWTVAPPAPVIVTLPTTSAAAAATPWPEATGVPTAVPPSQEELMPMPTPAGSVAQETTSPSDTSESDAPPAASRFITGSGDAVYFEDISDQTKHLVRAGCAACSDPSPCENPVAMTDDYINGLTVGMDFECDMMDNMHGTNQGGEVALNSTQALPAQAVSGATTTIAEIETADSGSGLGFLLWPLVAVVLCLAAFGIWKLVSTLGKGKGKSNRASKKGSKKAASDQEATAALIANEEPAPTTINLRTPNYQEMLPGTLHNLAAMESAPTHPQLEQLERPTPPHPQREQHPQLESRTPPRDLQPPRHPQQEQQYAPTITSMTQLMAPPATSYMEVPTSTQVPPMPVDGMSAAQMPTGILAAAQCASMVDQQQQQQQQLQQQQLQQQLQQQQLQQQFEIQQQQQQQQQQMQQMYSQQLGPPATTFPATQQLLVPGSAQPSAGPPATMQLAPMPGGAAGPCMPSTEYDVITVTPGGFQVSPYQQQQLQLQQQQQLQAGVPQTAVSYSQQQLATGPQALPTTTMYGY